nr:RluA family pseudouridine synthase [bacterium]
MQAFSVSAGEAGQRADVFMAQKSGLSRSRVQQMMEKGQILLEGGHIRPRDLVREGQCYTMELPPPEPTALVPEDIPLDIRYQDAYLAVINKPAGLVVHPAAGNPTGTLVHGLLYHIRDLSGIGGEMRPGIVHRLDKQTSGLMVVAKCDFAHQKLSDQLKTREMSRQYLALVRGRLSQEEGVIDAPIARHPVHRQRMAVVPGGRVARTHYRVLERLDAATLVALKLDTGRTHQIRVHMAYIGHPVLDDPVYGGAPDDARQMLHAWRLAFIHPKDGRPVAFTAPAPQDFLRRLRGLGGAAWAARIGLDLPDVPVL